MIPLASLMDFLGRLTSGNYVDIACAGLVLLCAGIGLARGISGELSRLVSLAIGATAGYWIYVPGVQTLASLAFLRKNPQFAGLIAFCVALLGGLICFLLLNYILSRIIKIVISTPLDRSLGLLAGLLNAVIFLALVFTLALILPDPSYRELLCRQSRVGRYVTPRLVTFLDVPNPATTTPEEEEDPDTAAPAKRQAPAAPVAAARPPAPAAARPAPQPVAEASRKPTAAQTPTRPAQAAPKTAHALKRSRPITKPLTVAAARPPATNGLVKVTAPTARRE